MEEKVDRAITACRDIWQPPKRISVTESVGQTLYIQQPGGYTGTWAVDETPYMREPMDMLSSRWHEAVCFVGPARSGKTLGLLDGWMSYAVTCDPGDMLIVQMTQEKAREYSKTRVDRAIRHSPALKELMSDRGHDDNTHDKMFKHGMFLKIGWPSATQLSSSDYRYVGLTDYDRMPDDVDGEGAPYALAVKRTQTFLSRGMCMVESSPGRDLIDPSWNPNSAHEAPPVNGVLGIYNRSDRRRWYWKCLDCGAWFEAAPGLGLFSSLPSELDLLDCVRKEDLLQLATKHAHIICPHCKSVIEQERKHLLNNSGMWIPDGVKVVKGEIIGDPIQSSIAGFWLGGVAAVYQPWQSIILRYLQGLREYVMTGAEETLKSTVNTDQGMPYLPRHLAEGSSGQMRKAEDLPRYIVPSEARFLIAAVDVQGGTRGRFVVQVHAVGEGMEQWIIDRYEIKTGPRGQDINIDPAGYPEDWGAITDRVVNSTYRIGDGKELRVMMTVVDSGGESGVTANAYSWYRNAKRNGLEKKVMLVKGDSIKTDSPIRKANARDPKGRPMRDVHLHLVNTDYFKDVVSASRRRIHAGAGYMHLPAWLPDTFHDELAAEVREKSGRWKQVRARNEALDLWVYVLSACWVLGAHKIAWRNPPGWALPLEDNNTNVITREDRKEEQEMRKADAVVVESPVVAVPRPVVRQKPVVDYGFGSEGWNL